MLFINRPRPSKKKKTMKMKVKKEKQKLKSTPKVSQCLCACACVCTSAFTCIPPSSPLSSSFYFVFLHLFSPSKRNREPIPCTRTMIMMSK